MGEHLSEFLYIALSAIVFIVAVTVLITLIKTTNIGTEATERDNAQKNSIEMTYQTREAATDRIGSSEGDTATSIPGSAVYSGIISIIEKIDEDKITYDINNPPAVLPKLVEIEVVDHDGNKVFDIPRRPIVEGGGDPAPGIYIEDVYYKEGKTLALMKSKINAHARYKRVYTYSKDKFELLKVVYKEQ